MVDTQFDVPRRLRAPAEGALYYLAVNGTLARTNVNVQRTIVGAEENRVLFELLDASGNRLEPPARGEAVIGSELRALYGMRQGDEITVLAGESRRRLVVSAIAFNAEMNCIYVSKNELEEMLALPEDSYNGVLSMENSFDGGKVTTNEQKLDALRRGAVSNQNSALINQFIGCVVGCFLLFLALRLIFKIVRAIC